MAWYYYTSRQKRRKSAERPNLVASKTENRATRSRDDGRGRRRKVDAATGISRNASADATSSGVDLSNGGWTAKQKSSKSKGPGKVADAAGATGSNGNHLEQSRIATREEEDEASMTNQEFAKQMVDLKAGKDLAAPGRSESRHQTKGRSHPHGSGKRLSVAGLAANGSGSRELSANSSTTGGDADDDLSPAVSPNLVASSTGQYVSGGDVSDMLEPAPARASVLKITESTRPTGPARPQQRKPVEPAETKKQRQNRQKAEEKKAARAEAEADRRVLLEKQLRTAREAEGRPARNGMGSSTAPPAPSVWATAGPPLPNGGGENGRGMSGPAPLLDTFDPEDGVHAGDSGRPAAASMSASMDSSGTRTSSIWDRDLPSEEDQMRMIQELDDSAGWNTVPKGRKGKKARNDSENFETEARAGQVSTVNGSSHPAPFTSGISGPKPGNSTSSDEAHAGADTGYKGLNGNTGYSHPADSDWAVL